jgi:hypothetical protein
MIMARGYKPTKKSIQDFLGFAVEVARIARPEYTDVSEQEALTLVGLALKENFVKIVCDATGATPEQVETARALLNDRQPVQSSKSPSMNIV